MAEPSDTDLIDQLTMRLSAALERADRAMDARDRASRAPSPSPSDDDGQLADLRAELELERRTRLDLAARLKAAEVAHLAEVAALTQALAEQHPQADGAPPPELAPKSAPDLAPVDPAPEMAAELAQLRARVQGLRAERDDARTEADALRAAASVRGDDPLSHIAQDLAQLRADLSRAQEVLAEIDQSAGVLDPELHHAALVAELRALKAQRAADALEIKAALSAIDAALEEGDA